MTATLSNIKTDSNWGIEAPKINQNFASVNVELEKLKSGTVLNKGYYKSLELLQDAYPPEKSKAGMIAYVGTKSPYIIYEYKAGSGWTSTGETYTPQVNLGDYYTREEADATQTSNEQKFQELELKLEEGGGGGITINGDVTNFPDDEDIESVPDTETQQDVLKLKDRPYLPSSFSGKGYKILRKNLVEGNNILTQNMIPLSDINIIYEVRYDFDLNGNSLTIPEGCAIRFVGGSIDNGILLLNNTVIDSKEKCFGDNIELKGSTLDGRIHFDWFSNNGTMLQKVIDYSDIKILHIGKTVECDDTIVISKPIRLFGTGIHIPTIKMSSSSVDGLYLKSSAATSEITEVYVRDGKVGLKCEAYSSYIHNCKFSYNKLGVILSSAYITRLLNCHITFNSIGVYAKGQNYETSVMHNIIDNNLGGIGMIVNGTTSPIIRYNTIEGNRVSSDANTYYRFGIGLILAGYHTITKVIDNWFEQNGYTDDSVDILAYYKATLGMTHQEYTDLLDKVNAIVAQFEDIGTLTSLNKGTIEISNMCTFTPNSYILTGYQTAYCLHNNKYGGTQGSAKYGKPVTIYGRPSTATLYDCSYNIFSEDIRGSYNVDKGDTGLGIFVNGNVNKLIVDSNSRIGAGVINLEVLNSFKVNFLQKIISGSNQSKYLAYSGKPFGDVYAYNCVTALTNETGDSFVEGHRGKVLLVIGRGDSSKGYPITYIKSGGSTQGFVPTMNSDGFYSLLPEITDDITNIYVGTNMEIMAIYAIPKSSWDTNYGYSLVKVLYSDCMVRVVSPEGVFSNAAMPAAEDIPLGKLIYNTGKKRFSYSDGTSVFSLEGSIYETKGSTNERPIPTTSDEGFEYYDTTLKKKILWNGTQWTNLDGTQLT